MSHDYADHLFCPHCLADKPDRPARRRLSPTDKADQDTVARAIAMLDGDTPLTRTDRDLLANLIYALAPASHPTPEDPSAEDKA